MKKNLKKIILVLLLLLIFTFGYYYSRKIEIAKISLKCSEKMMLIKDEPIEDIYYKITKKIFDDRPYRIYGSYPDTSDDNYPPYLLGVSDESLEGKDVKFKREQYAPTWYTFVQSEGEKSTPIPRLSTVTYINRENLEIEERFSEDGKLWSKGQCSIISNEKFNEIWSQQVKKIKEKMRF